MFESRSRVAISPAPRETGAGWVLDAVFPNGKPAAIAGFNTESEAHEWLGSARHVAWLRDTRTVFSVRLVVAFLECLGSYAAVLTAVASGPLQSARRRWSAVKTAYGGAGQIHTALAQLRAWSPACVVFSAVERASKRWSYRLSRSVFWRRALYRCLSTSTGTLLIIGIVLGILATVLSSLGRSEQAVGLATGATPMRAERLVVYSQSIEGTQRSDPIALLIDRVSSSEAAIELPTEDAVQILPPQPTAGDGLAGESPAATTLHNLRRAAPLAIVGVWAPETGSCLTRNTRERILPAVISEHGARAGETSCIFKKRKRTEKDWRMLANCTDGHEHWTSNVRLAVTGDRLVWRSERGTQAYTRCRSNV